MKTYKIGIHGCDDSTYVAMEMTKKQFEVVYKLAQLSHKNSTYGCQPTIDIEGHEIEDDED